MNLPELSIKKPVTVTMVTLILLIFGFVSLTKLPVELYPNTSFGEISIIIQVRGGIPPTEVEALVTKPIEEAVATVTRLCTDIFGLSLSRAAAGPKEEEIERLLKQREQARVNKDFKRSDKIRDALKEKGIIVEDTKDGQVWRRA